MIPLLERQESFVGGMNSLAAPAEYAPVEVSYLLNGLLDQDGTTIRPRGGSQRTHGTALNGGAQAWGAAEFFTAAGAQQLVVFVGDKMYYSTDEGATWTNPAGATGLGTAYWSLAQMPVGSANYLIGGNASSSLYYWDGTTWGTLAGAPSGVKYVAVFNNRLYVAGHDGERVAASAVADPTSWALPAAFEVAVQTNDGDTDITGLFSLAGVLLAFKRKSTAYIDGFGYQTLQVQSDARGVSRSVGCVAHRTIKAVGDRAVCWLSERGIEWYQAGGEIVLMSSKIQPTLDQVAWEEIASSGGICHASYLERDNEYRVAVPTSGTTTNLIVGLRPPRSHSQLPPALWLEDHPDGDAVADTDTAYVDGNGYLAYSATPSQLQVTVATSGYLTLPTVGGSSYVAISGGYFSLAGATGAQHAAMFTADVITEDLTGQLWSVGYDGFVRRLKYGTADDVASDGTGGNEVTGTVRSRPFWYGDQFRDKRARVLRIVSAQEATTSLNVRLVTDETFGTQKAITLNASAGPSTTRARFASKGQTFVAEVQFQGPIELLGLELMAEQLRERW